MIEIRKFITKARYLFWRLKKKRSKPTVDNVAYHLLTHVKQEPRFITELSNFKDDSVDSFRLAALVTTRKTVE